MKYSIQEKEIKIETPQENIIKYDQIICPKCLSLSKITFKDYKINLSKCQCKIKHQLDNILLEEFEDIQKKIPHNIMKINMNNYRCKIHKELGGELFNSYCKTCKKDLCPLCRSEHGHEFENHEIISLGQILPDKENLRIDFNKLKNAIKETNNNIEKIIFKLQKVKTYLEILKNIIYNFINNYNPQKRNFRTINNINKFKFDFVIEDLEKINEDININKEFKKIIDLYDKMMFTNEINIIYNINEEQRRNKEIKIFGAKFVENNKDKCKIIYQKKLYELVEKLKLNIDNNKNDNENLLHIKLIGVNKLTNMSNMFNNCSQLRILPDISKINTINITDISNMFDGCINLNSLPDISRWETCNLQNISGLFKGCSSLKSLPDISNWDVSSIVEGSNLFNGCSSLKSKPDLTIWKKRKEAQNSSINSEYEKNPNFDYSYENE